MDNTIYPGDPKYYKMLNAPDSVNEAFEKIIEYLAEVEEMSSIKSHDFLSKSCRAVESINRDQQSTLWKWKNQAYNEKKVAEKQAKIDRIKGFKIGQLVKFKPKAIHHFGDENHTWGIEHVIGRVTRRNKNTVSVIEVSRRRHSSDAEDTRTFGCRWRMSPHEDDIIDE